MNPKPTRPLPTRPAGYVELARYSSLGRFWTCLGGAERAGREITLVRGDTPDLCRRRVSGYALPGAALLLDTGRVTQALDDGFETHPALLALLAGDPGPLRAELNAHFELRLDFVLALTAARDLIARPEFSYVPLVRGLSDLPASLPLQPRRLARDEVHLLVQRACGLA
ncbi:hypothetical protein E5F05_14280 [Deinococcus metallilatus]|uniref:Uncharacterized protein n=1 Tax=Deinococcus metallilatus TaxID=1211322 RepID=A0AAJ5F599_9DEIO|nr:hypothetical protein [Deinococcus metallilatus]MBB5294236.1 hypothetical protein [Deinococcus metallilatus]QBY09012.1 hypothetical protein E5F05_14280 [Deinococcus metallilatus]RXJ10156.1 hypothetical protein ERJ73_13110 [Deinococcus metallilatus]TLK27907.1 hypothetical protein FCS05_08270 [Deinococcus metallilatus]GMA16427.1 hypothetical protein GCM10025871_27580 [Deinococcus metallilatus]